jgi:hypothetical protein
MELLGGLPEGTQLVSRASSKVDLVHLFTTRRAELERRLRSLRSTLHPDAAVWVSWPKKSSRVPTDITEDVIRTVALPMGWVDIKVCAVTDVWSGLKLVVRSDLRRGTGATRVFPALIGCLTLAASIASSALHAQAAPSTSPPTCRTSLDSLDAKVRQNYAGFLLEVRDERRQAYDSMRHRLAEAASTASLEACFPVLASYTSWYDDPHLFVFQRQVADSLEAARRASSLRRLPLTEPEVRASLQNAGRSLDPIEGIWYEGPLRLAVVRDPSGGARDFVAVVLQSDTAAWPVGAVRAHLRREIDDSYTARLLTRRFAEVVLGARIHKRVMLRLSPGIWGKAFPLTDADTGLVDTIDVHRPRVSLRRRSVVFSVPSHDGSQAGLLNALVRTHVDSIRSRPLLIVDLRGNEGGGSLTTRALHPFITTADKRPTPFDSGAPVMLSSPAQIAYAKRSMGPDTSAFVRQLVARLEANPGALVPLEDKPPAPAALEPHVAGNWKVVVLVDRGTVSAAEVLVLRALRSTRAVVVGQPTAGALDYQSVQIVSLGTGYPRWALGYPTITAHADLPRRGMRGKGIMPHVLIDWRMVADPIAEVERRFAP